jgi:hypothetical protein
VVTAARPPWWLQPGVFTLAPRGRPLRTPARRERFDTRPMRARDTRRRHQRSSLTGFGRRRQRSLVLAARWATAHSEGGTWSRSMRTTRTR